MGVGLRETVYRWVYGPDRAIDRLIAANRARARGGMATIDWARLDRLGQRRWHEVVRGQRKRPGDAVVAFRSVNRLTEES